MTASVTRHRLPLADPVQADALAAFLERLLRWEKNAAVRIQAGDGVAALFARPARFEVLAVRTARLADDAVALDTTVAAGELLELLDEPGATLAVPAPVTGPPWAGVLPPRTGWEAQGELPPDAVRTVAAAAVAEFRERAEALPEAERNRRRLDALAEEIWSRPLGRTGLPLRAAHAAHALGFLHGSRPLRLLAAGPWLRLATPHGSVAVRSGRPGQLPVTPA
ncbi:hypothetical protein V1J52_09085 [Streptomyces sp. TRM 70351]|uniref:hypothetical protein n=1 Tax=Streptomyces sp. TRM 70351 TaxID=3116552 RepID=UPI002E7BC061|nr:hypothetical protein [Streptomyces sp. TRM 70351]MEE1928347.1 hypothetical protein [Streptomyces sp. TRM 70351]